MNNENIILMKKINNTVCNVKLNEKELAILTIAIDNSLNCEKYESLEILWNINSQVIKSRIKEVYTPQHFYIGRALRTLPNENKEFHFSFTECFLLKKRLSDIRNSNISLISDLDEDIRKEYLQAICRLLDKLSRATKGCIYLQKPLNKLIKNDLNSVLNIFENYAKKITLSNIKKLDINEKIKQMEFPSKYNMLFKYLNGTIGSDNQNAIELLKDMSQMTYDNNGYGFEVNAFERIPRHGADLNNSTIAMYYTELHGYDKTDIKFKRKLDDLEDKFRGYEEISKEDFIKSYNNSALKEKTIFIPGSMILVKDDFQEYKGYSFIKSQILKNNNISKIIEEAIDQNDKEKAIEYLDILNKIANNLKDNVNSDCKNLKKEKQDIYDIAVKYLNRTLCSTNQSLHNLMQDVINVMYDNGGLSAAIILNELLDEMSMVIIEREPNKYEIKSISFFKYNCETNDYDEISDKDFNKLYLKAITKDIIIEIPEKNNSMVECLFELRGVRYEDGYIWRNQYTYCSASVRGDYARDKYYFELYSKNCTENTYQGYCKDILDSIINELDLKLPNIPECNKQEEL